MNHLIVLLVSFLCLPTVFASELPSVVKSNQTIELSAKFEVSSEHEELDLDEVAKDGWQLAENKFGDQVFVLNVSVKTSELPFSTNLGPAFLKISKTGLVEMGTSIGDQDAGSDAELQLPHQAKKLLGLSDLHFKSSGGDYASGAWSFSGDLRISVRN